MTEFRLTPFDMLLLNTPPKFLKDETRKIRKNILSKKNYYDNWETRKIRRDNNKESRKEYNAEYNLKNADLLKEKRKIFAQENPNYCREVCQRYRDKQNETNREEFLKRQNESSRKSWINNYDNAIKWNRKKTWKQRGLNMEHFEEIYEIYMITTHCDFCEVELTDGKIRSKTTKCMDHSHITGEFRNILCIACNSSLPDGT